LNFWGRYFATRAAPDSALLRTPLRALYQCGTAPCFRRHFFFGVAFCYFFVFGKVFQFIQQFAPKSITAAPDIEEYLSFVLGMFLAFGLAFEVPVAVILLVRMGIVTVVQLRAWRGYFWVLAAVGTAMVTPPDAGSMMILLAVVGGLYEVGIVAAQVFVKHTKAPEEEGEAAKP
jgi:sec-independent protein translocase protein TatC